MIGIRRLVVIRQMARTACSGCACESVVCMAVGARNRCMASRQREPCFAVIKDGAQPVRGGVADRTVFGKTGRHVVRIRRLVEVRGVAGIAVRSRQSIVAVGVTCLAGYRGMSPCQRKGCHVVVEFCTRPTGGRMTH